MDDENKNYSNTPRKSVDLLNRRDLSPSTVLDFDNVNFFSNELNQTDTYQPVMNNTDQNKDMEKYELPEPSLTETTQTNKNLNESSLNKLDLAISVGSAKISSPTKVNSPVKVSSPAIIPQTESTTINLSNAHSFTSSTTTTATKNIYYNCAFCQYKFMFNDLDNKMVKCPNCQNDSSLSDDFKNINGIVWLLLFLAFLTIGLNTEINQNILNFVFKFLMILACFLSLVRSVYFFTLKVSPLNLNST